MDRTVLSSIALCFAGWMDWKHDWYRLQELNADPNFDFRVGEDNSVRKKSFGEDIVDVVCASPTVISHTNSWIETVDNFNPISKYLAQATVRTHEANGRLWPILPAVAIATNPLLSAKNLVSQNNWDNSTACTLCLPVCCQTHSSFSVVDRSCIDSYLPFCVYLIKPTIVESFLRFESRLFRKSTVTRAFFHPEQTRLSLLRLLNRTIQQGQTNNVGSKQQHQYSWYRFQRNHDE